MGCGVSTPKLVDWIPEERLNWHGLSMNPRAIHLLKAHPERINWCNLSRNPGALELLKANRDKINWNFLHLNPNPKIREMLRDHPEHVVESLIDGHLRHEAPPPFEVKDTPLDWYELSANSCIFI